MLQILQLVEEGRADLLQEMLGQRLEFGVWVLGTRVVDGVMPGYRYSSCIYVISPDVSYRYAGTAGLRGKMGPGFNRMNRLVVQQTAQGLYR